MCIAFDLLASGDFDYNARLSQSELSLKSAALTPIFSLFSYSEGLFMPFACFIEHFIPKKLGICTFLHFWLIRER